jgi:choline kinase
MRVRVESGHLTGIGSHIPAGEGSGNFIGIARFSPAGSQLLLEQMEEMAATSRNEYYTVAVDRLAKRGVRVGYVDVAGRPWVEIDTVEDLERAHILAGAGSG